MPDPSIEIVDKLFQPVQNPYEDRITAILQKRAQPQSYAPSQVNDATQAAQYMALAGRSGNGVEQILDSLVRQPQLQQQNAELDSAQGLYNLFEQKRASGDKQAQALFDKISLFTGGDPEGTAMFLDQLHADPESIDPGNAFQVMTKLAGIAKKTGYASPESQMKKLELQKTKAEINKLNAPNKSDEIKPLSEGGKRAYDKTHGFIANDGLGILDIPDANTRQQVMTSQAVVHNGPNVRENLQRALDLNDKSFDTGIIPESVKSYAARTSGYAKDELVNTREFHNIIDRTVLAQLRSFFGNRPTQYELQILSKIEGSGNYNRAERAANIKEAINYMDQKEQESKQMLNDIGYDYSSPNSSPDNKTLQTPSGIKYRVVQ